MKTVVEVIRGAELHAMEKTRCIDTERAMTVSIPWAIMKVQDRDQLGTGGGRGHRSMKEVKECWEGTW